MRPNRALLVGLTAASLALPVSIGVPARQTSPTTAVRPWSTSSRAATARFRNLDTALAEGYVLNGGCVAAPSWAPWASITRSSACSTPCLDVNNPEVLVDQPRAGRAASRRRGVRHAGGSLERRPSRGDAATEGTPPPLYERPQSLRPRRLLRAARVGLEAEPEQPVRGLGTRGCHAWSTRWTTRRAARVKPPRRTEMPIARASRSPAGARRSAVMAADCRRHRSRQAGPGRIRGPEI